MDSDHMSERETRQPDPVPAHVLSWPKDIPDTGSEGSLQGTLSQLEGDSAAAPAAAEVTTASASEESEAAGRPASQPRVDVGPAAALATPDAPPTGPGENTAWQDGAATAGESPSATACSSPWQYGGGGLQPGALYAPIWQGYHPQHGLSPAFLGQQYGGQGLATMGLGYPLPEGGYATAVQAYCLADGSILCSPIASLPSPWEAGQTIPAGRHQQHSGLRRLPHAPFPKAPPRETAGPLRQAKPPAAELRPEAQAAAAAAAPTIEYDRRPRAVEFTPYTRKDLLQSGYDVKEARGYWQLGSLGPGCLPDDAAWRAKHERMELQKEFGRVATVANRQQAEAAPKPAGGGRAAKPSSSSRSRALQFAKQIKRPAAAPPADAGHAVALRLAGLRLQQQLEGQRDRIAAAIREQMQGGGGAAGGAEAPAPTAEVRGPPPGEGVC